ncbi:glycosyltransferase [Enterobacter huaxiensis]|uniref:glycosyltransferase family protein n=1 Tax=Enterobacter huaxiensis TaxID=2494702 RepID=UPI002175FE7B|nr:glycosyltransferase [Enterobacter huaxiensis]MCS5452509.1 glycosyltransferase [Enterobacter huaxiensis]
MRLNRLQIEINHSNSCDYHRLKIPFSNIVVNARNHIYVFNRISNSGAAMLRTLKIRGFKIICDVDDYWVLDDDHYLADVYKASGMADQIIESLKLADYVTVTTPLLASKVRQYNKKVVVIPNALPFDEGQFTRSEDKESGRPFIYVAGASHRNDIKILDGLYSHIAIAGANKQKEWDKIIRMAKGAAFKEELPADSYMDAYNGHKVALAPLVGSPFNACKSNLKMLEAGAKGLPLIASPVSPYWNAVDKDVVLWARDKEAFREQMVKLYRNPRMLEDCAERLAEHVRLHYSLAEANELRRQLIESI